MTPNTLTLIVSEREESLNVYKSNPADESDRTFVEIRLVSATDVMGLPDPSQGTRLPPGICAASIHIKGWSAELVDYTVGSKHLITLEPHLELAKA